MAERESSELGRTRGPRPPEPGDAAEARAVGWGRPGPGGAGTRGRPPPAPAPRMPPVLDDAAARAPLPSMQRLQGLSRPAHLPRQGAAPAAASKPPPVPAPAMRLPGGRLGGLQQRSFAGTSLLQAGSRLPISSAVSGAATSLAQGAGPAAYPPRSAAAAAAGKVPPAPAPATRLPDLGGPGKNVPPLTSAAAAVAAAAADADSESPLKRARTERQPVRGLPPLGRPARPPTSPASGATHVPAGSRPGSAASHHSPSPGSSRGSSSSGSSAAATAAAGGTNSWNSAAAAAAAGSSSSSSTSSQASGGAGGPRRVVIAADGSSSGPITRHAEPWRARPSEWKTVQDVSAAAAELGPRAEARRRRGLGVSAKHTDLAKHVELYDSPLTAFHGPPAALALKAYELNGVLRDTNGRPHAHSDNLQQAAAGQIGQHAVQLYVAAGLGAERHHRQRGRRMEAVSVQLVANLPEAGSIHKDTANTGSSSSDDAQRRDISRLLLLLTNPAATIGAQLGCLAFMLSQTGSDGGVLVDIAGRTLSCTKAILGAESAYFHQVSVLFSYLCSVIVELRPVAAVGKKRKRETSEAAFFQDKMVEARASPAPPAPPAVTAEMLALLGAGYPQRLELQTAGPIPRLHSNSAAGTASMAMDGVRPDGKSVRATDAGSLGGQQAWTSNREEKLVHAAKGAAAAGAKAAAESLGFMANPAQHGAANARQNTCNVCIFKWRAKAGEDEEALQQAVASSQPGQFGCDGGCGQHPLTGLKEKYKSRLFHHIHKGKACTDAAIAFILREESSGRGGARAGAGQRSDEEKAASRAGRNARKNEKQQVQRKAASLAGAQQQAQQAQPAAGHDDAPPGPAAVLALAAGAQQHAQQRRAGRRWTAHQWRTTEEERNTVARLLQRCWFSHPDAAYMEVLEDEGWEPMPDWQV